MPDQPHMVRSVRCGSTWAKTRTDGLAERGQCGVRHGERIDKGEAGQIRIDVDHVYIEPWDKRNTRTIRQLSGR